MMYIVWLAHASTCVLNLYLLIYFSIWLTFSFLH